jgi:hypothetical protein
VATDLLGLGIENDESVWWFGGMFAAHRRKPRLTGLNQTLTASGKKFFDFDGTALILVNHPFDDKHRTPLGYHARRKVGKGINGCNRSTATLAVSSVAKGGVTYFSLMGDAGLQQFPIIQLSDRDEWHAMIAGPFQTAESQPRGFPWP